MEYVPGGAAEVLTVNTAWPLPFTTPLSRAKPLASITTVPVGVPEPVTVAVKVTGSPTVATLNDAPSVVELGVEPAPGNATVRTRPFLVSAINNLPEGSTNTPCGLFSAALVAGPPSPLKLSTSSPATV